MKLFRLIAAAGCLIALVWTAAGCKAFHNLQPHRLHRLNRGNDMSRDGYNFSIPDPAGSGASAEPRN